MNSTRPLEKGKITELYFDYQQEYERKYGKQTVVLMQIGKFYEMYEYDPANVLDKDIESDKPINTMIKRKTGHATVLSQVLNIHLGKRNGSKPYSVRNPSMIGFPTIAYDKYRDALLLAGYTIIRVDQKGSTTNTGKVNKNVERYVGEILSPATDLRDVGVLPITNCVLCIYVECQKTKHKNLAKFEDYLVTCGLACVDVSTGKNIVCEVYSKLHDEIHAIQEVYRFISSQHPREIIIYVDGLDEGQDEAYKNFLYDTFELSKYSTVIIHCNTMNKEYTKLTYQQQFLAKAFSSAGSATIVTTSKLKLNIKTANSSIFEDLHIEKYIYGRIAYICLLQYCYEHNETIITKLNPPETNWIDASSHLILAHNALRQLEVFNVSAGSNGNTRNLPILHDERGSVDSLISVVDNTSTALGRRYLETMLANPISHVETLESYYNMTDEMIKFEDELLNPISKLLKSFPDIERYQRKLVLKLIQPNEFSRLFTCYVKIVEVVVLILNAGTTHLNQLLFGEPYTTQFNSCLSDVFTMYNVDNLRSCKIVNDNALEYTDMPVNPGFDSVTDGYLGNIAAYDETLKKVIAHLNGFLNSTRGKLLEVTSLTQAQLSKTVGDDPEDNGETGGMAIVTTEHKGKVLKQHLHLVDTALCGDLKIVTLNKKVVVTSDKIEAYCTGLQQSRVMLTKHLHKMYMELLNGIVSKYKFFGAITKFVGTLDFVKSNGRTAIKNKYFRPTIDRSNEDTVSYCQFTKLRHPIAEKLTDAEYKTNDVSLGKSPQGRLLYGFNGIGKSVLTKAIGLNVILAQAGCFTPSQMIYKPYSKIVTRLSGEDNLFKGQSSFIVEMTELRTILRNKDGNTLVLGDELCRGTETMSGTGLTVATILSLLEAKTSFIFSTHMHHLPKLDQIKDIPSGKLEICHLTASYDELTKTLVYDRQLRIGQGKSIYGLEVAKSLNIDKDFIDLANTVRREMSEMNKEFFSTKKSRYNSKVYMDSCSICGETKASYMVSRIAGNTVLHTHHIKEQEMADDKGFIEHMPKNKKGNLLVVCSDCHTRIHKDKLSVVVSETPTGDVITVN